MISFKLVSLGLYILAAQVTLTRTFFSSLLPGMMLWLWLAEAAELLHSYPLSAT